jgi:ParB-like chromosome segregation protein Spo0J
VGGNQRLKALRELGIEEVDVVVVDINDAKEKALNVALNKISGEWDFPKLKDLLTDIDTGDFDIELTGFDLDEIGNLISQFSILEDTSETKESVKENECPKCGYKW